MTTDLITINPTEITVFNQFEAQLAEIYPACQEAAKRIDFDSLAGKKEAKALLMKCAKTRTAIAEAHRVAKADALAFGRLVDAGKNDWTAKVVKAEDLLRAPLDEAIRKDQSRLDEIRAKIRTFATLLVPMDSETLKANQQKLIDTAITEEEYQELWQEAMDARKLSLEALPAMIEGAEKREADAAKMKKLEDDNAALRQQQHDQRVADQAVKDAEAKAQQERDEGIRREEKLKADKDAAEKRATDAEEEARKKLADEQEQERKAEEARKADEANRTAKHKDIMNDLVKAGFGFDIASDLIEAINSGAIRHISITY